MTVAGADPRNVLGTVPGRLCVGATDLTAAYPHGGTDLGEMGDCALSIEEPVQIIRGEEWGNGPVQAVSAGEAVAMAFMLREWNMEAYSRFFLNSAAGTPSGHATIGRGAATNRAGYLYEDRAAKFVFSPRDFDNHPGVIIYHGAPVTEDTTDLLMQMGGAESALEVPCVLLALYESATLPYYVGRLADATL